MREWFCNFKPGLFPELSHSTPLPARGSRVLCFISCVAATFDLFWSEIGYRLRPFRSKIAGFELGFDHWGTICPLG